MNDALIVGGGIGGLTAALCLGKFGIRVRVFEQAREFDEIGAGIQLSPNCTRVLFDLGLEQALNDIAFVPLGGEMRSWRTGNILTSSILGESVSQRYGFPYLHVHRADLIQLLGAAVRENSNIELNTQTTVTHFEQDDVSVTVEIDGQRHVGGVLIGADGIHSVIREGLFGKSSPSFTGNVAWRALVPVDRLPKGLIQPMATAWWGPAKHFVHYYVRRGEMVNCVCVVEKKGWEIESWTQRGDLQELKQDFAGWHEDVQILIHAVQDHSLYKWALFDRAPMQRWGMGRVTLLGDACHPTLPFMAQGAAMAIEDGAVLARCLNSGLQKRSPDVPGQLIRYAALRRERTAKIQLGSRKNAKIFHMSGLRAWVRDRAVKKIGTASRMHTLFSYNALEEH
ncbi:MAG: NAD(P)-binding protein [Gammaproteobacteria bacterium]|nr:NAD(P)-binding protein [Gammaproteobacteria bacterium]